MPENTSGNGRLGEWIIAAAMAAAVGGGVALSDVDPALELHNSILGNTEDSFDRAKEQMYNRVDRDNDSVRCVYSDTFVNLVDDNGKLKPDPAAGVQAEHTWASKAKWVGEGYHFKRSSVPGADLHHLYPVRRGINASRGNHPFGALGSDARELFVNADGTLNDEEGGTRSGSRRDPNEDGITVFQPRADHRGNVARAMFYMSVRYWMPITDDMEDALRQWHVNDPVDDAEIGRNNRVQNVQGNRNPFIDDPSLVETIDDY